MKASHTAALAIAFVALASMMPSGANEWQSAGGAWALYKKNCAGCHGFQGQGISPVGPPLMNNALVVNAPAETLAQIIRTGRKGADKAYGQYLQGGQVGYMNMPPFDYTVISDTELRLLVNYLKNGFQRGQFNEP